MPSMRSKGERALVEYALRLMRDSKGLLPPGDDAAAIPLGDQVLVVKTDFLAGITDVPPGMSPRQVGWKTVTMNISDLVAKGAKPIATMFSVALPGDYDFEGARELVSSLFESSRFYGAEYLGGDTGEAEGLLVAGMALGLAKKEELMRRDGAQPGDILAVTGEFGWTALGLRILLRRLKVEGEIHERALDSVYNPRARLKEGLALARTQTITSSTDSSDGLAWSIQELSEESGVGFTVNSLPISKELAAYAKSKRLSSFDLAFYGGEEYELVVTVGGKDWSKAESAVRKAGGCLTRIGKAVRRKRILWAPRAGLEREIEGRGYEHFEK